MMVLYMFHCAKKSVMPSSSDNNRLSKAPMVTDGAAWAQRSKTFGFVACQVVGSIALGWGRVENSLKLSGIACYVRLALDRQGSRCGTVQDDRSRQDGALMRKMDLVGSEASWTDSGLRVHSGENGENRWRRGDDGSIQKTPAQRPTQPEMRDTAGFTHGGLIGSCRSSCKSPS